MAFNTQGEDDPLMSEINVTPLVDVMLVLLVVFIVTAPLLNNAVRVTLPKTVATAAPDVKRSASVPATMVHADHSPSSDAAVGSLMRP